MKIGKVHWRWQRSVEVGRDQWRLAKISGGRQRSVEVGKDQWRSNSTSAYLIPSMSLNLTNDWQTMTILEAGTRFASFCRQCRAVYCHCHPPHRKLGIWSGTGREQPQTERKRYVPSHSARRSTDPSEQACQAWWYGTTTLILLMS